MRDKLKTVDCIADNIGWVNKGGKVNTDMLKESFKDTIAFRMKNPKMWKQCEEKANEYIMSNKKMLIKTLSMPKKSRWSQHTFFYFMFLIQIFSINPKLIQKNVFETNPIHKGV
jgi:hypothetical protein